MATPKYFDPADIETQARYRPGVASNIFNVLTGGLAGQITGSTQKAQESARARQALLQEEFGKRDEQRMLERQLLINSIQQGIELSPGGTFDERMADFRNKSVRKTLAAAQGAREGIQSPTGPYQSPYQSDPAFQIAAAQAQADLEKKRVELQQTEDIQRMNLFNQAKGFGINVEPDATAGEIQAAIESKRPSIQAGAYTEEAGKKAKAHLRTLQGMGFVPFFVNVDSMSNAEAIANADIYGRKQQQSDFIGAQQRAEKAETQALRDFNQLLATPNVDKNTLQEAYYKLGKKEQENEEFRIFAQVPRAATPKENESLDSYISSIGKASSLAKSIYELAGDGEISKVSKANFNGFKSWFRGLQNTYGAEDAKLRSINNVIQEFQTLIAEQRKDFFGASLTNNELETAKQLFADPNQANFLPRVIALVDSIMSKDEIKLKYDRRGIFVNPATKKDVQDARNQWDETKKKYNFGGMGATSGAKTNEINALKDEFERLNSFITNAPASMSNSIPITR
jgi:hypothetical protein